MSEVPRWKSYEYRSNSNAVLQSSHRVKPAFAGSGEPESLLGRLHHRMGDLYRPPAVFDPDLLPAIRVGRSGPKKPAQASVLEDPTVLANVRYQPRSAASRAAYESILQHVQSVVGDQSLDVAMSVADEVLAVLKDVHMRPAQRQTEVASFLGEVSADDMNALHKYAYAITDYAQVVDASQMKDAEPSHEDGEGISVVLGGHASSQEDSSGDDSDHDVDTANDHDTTQQVPRTIYNLVLETVQDPAASQALANKLEMVLANLTDPADVATTEARLLEALDYAHVGLVKAILDLTSSHPMAPNHPGAPLDLQQIAFADPDHVMTNVRCVLPEGTIRTSTKAYEQIIVPGTQAPPPTRHVPITELPTWAQPAFRGLQALNRVQSAIRMAALEGGENLLMCAPTGSGKTNVALLCMLHEIGLRRHDATETATLKMVYLAPMKSLVQEMVATFADRLQPYGLAVAELSGDASLTHAQLRATHLLVATPEKWEIVTRRAPEAAVARLALLVIDEVHLLHERRGAVVETIVARTVRQVERTRRAVRLVGLSATLPNHHDVAAFLRVPPDGIFAFPNAWRPIPLELHFLGVRAQKPFRRHQAFDAICAEKVAAFAGEQVLIFVHSRGETARTARAILTALRQTATLDEALRGVRTNAATMEVLREAAREAAAADLRTLLPEGFGIHHAGLSRADRTLVEALFADRRIQVLVSTATLAWGVNLPAHAVVIRGTQVYRPEAGGWRELSATDVTQMLGRAGRPQYDAKGVGVVITTAAELSYYLSLTNQQLPVESQLVRALPDALNAEVATGAVPTVDEAVEWLRATYLFVRLCRAPQLYGLAPPHPVDQAAIDQHLGDLVRAAATALDRANLVRYDRSTARLQPTDLGDIAAAYAISSASMVVFAEHLRDTTDDVELFRVFSLAHDFNGISVRADERKQVERLAAACPIPVPDAPDTPQAKVNVLLQAGIARLHLQGHSICADAGHVLAAAPRIMRGLFEIAVARGWATVAERALAAAISAERRCWVTESPLRQFPAGQLAPDLLARLERRELNAERLLALTPEQLATILRDRGAANRVYRLAHYLPRLEVLVTAVPTHPDLLQVDLAVTPDFEFAPAHHGDSVRFHLFVTNVDGDQLLHCEPLVIKRAHMPRADAETELLVRFRLPLTQPAPPLYQLKVLPDRWIGPETTRVISFKHLVAVAAGEAPRQVVANTATMFQDVAQHTDASFMVCGPAASGRHQAVRWALERHWDRAAGPAILVVPTVDATRVGRLVDAYQSTYSGRRVMRLRSGAAAANARMEGGDDLIICNGHRFAEMALRWKRHAGSGAQRPGRLIIVDGIHQIGDAGVGPPLEVGLARVRAAVTAAETTTRLVLIGLPIWNAGGLADWLNIPRDNVFNFDLSARTTPIDIRVVPFRAAESAARREAMYRALAHDLGEATEPTLVVVESAKMAAEIMARKHQMGFGEHEPRDDMVALHGSWDVERATQSNLAAAVATHPFVARYGDLLRFRHVIIFDVATFSSQGGLRNDIPIATLQTWLGMASCPGAAPATATVYTVVSRRNALRRLLTEPLAVESALDRELHDVISAEVAAHIIQNRQDAVDDLTWTYYYRRLLANPNYYNFRGKTAEDMGLHLSEQIEATIADLEEIGCLTARPDEEEAAAAAAEGGGEAPVTISPLNTGLIAAFYGIRTATIEVFARSIAPETRSRHVLALATAAAEFDDLAPVRSGAELSGLNHAARHLPIIEIPPDHQVTKAHVLLGLYLARETLPRTWDEDLQALLEVATPLVHAIVDVAASAGYLFAAIAAMELMQLLAQRMLDTDHAILQLPHISREAADRFKAAVPQADSIFDLVGVEPERAIEILGISADQLAEIHAAIERVPVVDIAHRVELSDEEGPAQLHIILDFGEQTPSAWWVVVGDPAADALLGIKRINVSEPHFETTVKFDAPQQGCELALYLISDRWVGCDQEIPMAALNG